MTAPRTPEDARRAAKAARYARACRDVARRLHALSLRATSHAQYEALAEGDKVLRLRQAHADRLRLALSPEAQATFRPLLWK